MVPLIAHRPLLHMTSDLARVMAAARAREAAGLPVIHLERGEPDFDTPPHIVEALERAARGGETHYPDARGSMPLREAIAAKLARENRLDAHVDDLVVTIGGTHALFMAFQAILASGDELLVLSPHWMAIPKLVAFVDGARMRTLPAYLELMSGKWSDTEFAARLEAAITPATRGLYLNSPNNPTGAVLTEGQLGAIAQVAIERNLWVVSDEAYEHLVYDGSRHVSIGALPGMAERTLTAFTFSKSYAMTGWRVGYVVTPPSLRGVMGPILSFYTTHGVFPAAQSACRAAVLGSQDCVEQMRVAYGERRRSMLDGLAGQDAVTVPTPLGTFYAFAHVTLGDRELWSLVEDWLSWGVAVLPGTAFGPEYVDWVRMSLATRSEQVVEAARILRERHAGVRSGVGD
jgi:aspartate aminotransferase